MELLTLPDLGYEYSALEPYIDARTMEIHHTKHHAGYTNKANAVLEKYPELLKRHETPEELMRAWRELNLPESDKTVLKNNLGGHLNHALFWSLMDPELDPDQTLRERVVARFGSLDRFKEEFSQVAVGHFGSGWAWLVEDDQGDLELYSTPNQDSPYLKGHKPLIGLDVWEHAYYLKYQNRRPEYIENWWQVLKLI